ncbi:hypothetical protein ES708_33804 [subsurface metagenome]
MIVYAVARIFTKILEHLGQTVTIVSNGEEAIDTYQQALQQNQKFDLVFLDLIIPGGLGGKEVIAALKTIDPDIRAIISSGYINGPVINNFAEFGFAGVLNKPFSTKQIQALLSKNLF